MSNIALANPLVEALERDGIVVVGNLIEPGQLREMQEPFAARLRRLRWNDVDGYERTERYRHMVQDVLTLAQGFVDAALDPRVTEALRGYIGPNFALCEAKGWRSLPVKRDFHGWHGDMWYDQTRVTGIPREVKLAIYLTDVTSGAFEYLRGTHGKEAPRHLKRGEIDRYDLAKKITMTGRAGTAFLFDTSGIHRQSVPILEERHAVFLNYHDSEVPLQQEDVEYYRYHPLLLNAAFLGDLDDEQRRVLGFGNKTHYQPHYARQTSHRGFHRLMTWAYGVKLMAGDYRRRIFGKLGRLFGRGK
jgi:hypothetical protein